MSNERMTIVLKVEDGDREALTTLTKRDAWTKANFVDYTDFDIEDASMNVDRQIIEHNAYCCCDEECTATPNRKLLAAMTWERDRRIDRGEHHNDPEQDARNAAFLEPFGEAWQHEQRERMDHGYGAHIVCYYPSAG